MEHFLENRMGRPLKITIITPVYNGEIYLEETIKSISCQTYDDIEYIVVDGFSEDNTIGIVNAYRDVIDKIIVKSDNSMYEAINRGIEAASGDYMLVLNSDDCLVDKDTIQKVVDFINCHPGCLAYYGNIMKREGNLLSKRKVFQISKQHLLYTRHCTLIPHPALFVDREGALTSVGQYDLSYSYASDFDYILRLLENGIVKHMNIFVSIFRIHQNSITASGMINQDRLAILNRYDDSRSKFTKTFYYYLIWSTYKVLNFVANRR